MRIISGSLKGRKLIVPKDKNIRPTSDRSKEMIFNTLSTIFRDENITFEDMNVLDGCCGTGALGIESLSRGAKKTLFADISLSSINLAKKNCQILSLDKKSSFLKIDLTSVKNKKLNINLFFLDPPYNHNIYNKILTEIINKCWVSNNAIGVIEIQKNQQIENTDSIKIIKKKKIRNSIFYFIRIRNLFTTK